jgi:hypothetical protein
VVVPVASSKLPKHGVREVWNKVRNRDLPEVERGPEQHCDGIDRTKFDIAVTDGPVLVRAACLVVFGIVQ